MKKLKQLAVVLLLTLCSTAAYAQLASLKDGAVYHFRNVGNTGIALSASALSDVAGSSSNTSDKSQQWYVKKNGNYYTFRNLGNGRYLQGAGTSASWGLTSDASADANLFELASAGGNNTLRSKANSSNTYAYMHRDNGNNIVGWESGNTNTQWTLTTVDYTTAQLNAIWNELATFIPDEATVSGYQAALNAIFADAACTELNGTFASMSVNNIMRNGNYLKLPAELQAMVLKVRRGDWTETNAASGKSSWSGDYARKFRVQMYEPYSVEGEITSYLRFNAHSNMDNPTGLYANSGQPMYIMVEGEIAEGAELWVAHVAGHGLTYYYDNAAYTQLKEGLNVVPYFSDGSQLWINYVVHTYNSNGATLEEQFPHKISDFKPLKIHIEGGHINGYYNAIGDFRAADSGTEDLWGAVDNDADWDYYKERAPLNGTDGISGDFALLGHRQTLLFELGDITDDGGGTQKGLLYHLDNITVPAKPYNNSGLFSDYTNMGLDASTGKINIMLEAWDRIMYSELATMGLVSTSTMEKMNLMYPRWTAEGAKAEIYNYGKSAADQQTYAEFCRGLDYSEYFNHHGAAVGAYSGYMSGGWRCCNYHYNTMGSVIGKIANEAGPTWGPAHEIGHQHQGTFNLNGQTEVTNNFFSNVAVWYMGMGTSRYNGSEGSLQSVLNAFNTEGNDAYTNNIWALTHIYYRLWLYYHLAGNNTQFWPRLYELCRRVPIVNGGQILGETSLLLFYQHACDAAGEDLTEFFRAHGYLEVMDNRLVGDYSNAYYNQTQEQIDAAIATVKAKNYPENLAVLFINDGTSETTLQHNGVTARSLWDGNPSADYGSVTDFIEGNASVEEAYTAVVDANGNVTMSGGEGGVGFIVLNEDGEIVSFSNKSSFSLSEEAAYLVATGAATISAVNTDSETIAAEVDFSAMQSALLSELIGKVQAVIDLSDATDTKIGFYRASELTKLAAALTTAKEQLTAGTGLVAAYEMLYSEYDAVLNNEAAIIPFSPAHTYILTNYAYPTRKLVVSGGVIYANENVSDTDNAARWTFRETAAAGVYNVVNAKGQYAPKISQSSQMEVTAEANAEAKYVVESLGKGLWAVSLTPWAENSSFHAAANASYKVVGWETRADATKWYLTAVELDEDVVANDKLAALLTKTQELIDKMATVEDVKTALALQVDKESNPYYLSCSNVHIGEGSMAELIDNNNSTYMHTNWSNVSATNDWLDVDLGSGNALSMFAFSEVTRSGANYDFPKTIEIYGSNTKSNKTSDYTLITTVTGLPQSGGQTWESDAIIASKAYRYLRFVVTTGTNRIYFHMAEFDLYSAELNVTMLDEFTSVNTELVKSAYINMLKAANAATADVATATTNLQASYDALLAAYDEAIASLLDGEKAALQALIDQTNELIDNVGSVEYVPGGAVDLHGKIYCNSPYTAGGTGHSDYSSAANDYNLLDGDVNTHFHSDYNTATMVADPYVRIDLGEGNAVQKFKFNYTTRTQGGCAPTAISVYGGNYDSNILGDVTTADYLSKVTTATRIVIKNISGTNSYYFAGTSNVEAFSNDVIFVWEPVKEGFAGSYYLRLENGGDNGYLQAGSGAITLGTKASAQVFAVTEPSTSGNGSTYFNGDNTVSIKSNYVRFVQGSTAGETWINCQKTSQNPIYNSGQGGYTIHNVYLMGAPSYNAKPVAEFTSSALTTAIATKWTSSDITADKAYRYYKFVVTASQGTNNAGHFFVMSEFGFSKVAVEEVTVNTTFAEYVDEAMLLDAARSISNAEAAMEFATTAEQLQVQQNELQAAYDVLQEAYNNASNLEEFKAQLQELVERTNELLNASADCEYEYSPEYLTTNSYNITSNAGQNSEDGNTGGTNDGAGIAGLLDEDPETYFHSRWGGAVVNEAHYLQIDLGEGNKLSDFAFEYATRKTGSAYNTSPAPTAIEVRAGNDPATLGSAAAIATYTKDENDLPAYSDLGASWTSDRISADENSRYIRLTVTKSEGPASNSSYGGQYFFAMGTLKVVKMNKDYILSATAKEKYSVASNEVAATLAEFQAAVALLKTDASASALASQLNDLQAAYDALDAKIKLADSYPVYLTGDANNPVVYNIYINRAATTLLKYDADSKKVAVEDFVAGRKAQGWYFMPAADGKIKIYPYTGEGNLLATNDYTEGADRVEAVAEGTEGYGYEWKITRITDSEWYNITILNDETTYYFSNHGGTSNKMGFYNTDPDSDGGSMFKFQLADYSKSEAYYTLLNYFNSLGGLASVSDDIVGCYNKATGDTYNNMYFNAKDLLEDAEASDAHLTEAYNNLKAAAEALELTMPKEGSYYSIKSAHTDYAAASYIYNEKTDRRVAWSTDVNTQNAQAVWQFVEDGDNLYLTNLHTGSSVAEYDYNSRVYTQDEGAAISLISIDAKDAQVGMQVGTNASKLIHAQNYQGNIVTWETKTAGSASAWKIATVNKADISYTVSIGAAEWATLCLNYPVTVPAGVKAYAVVGVEGGSVLLQSVGDVIAAGVPVLLNGAQNSYEFKHADTEGTVPETNLLMGSCYDIFVEAESGMQYYILALNAQGNVAMCIVYHEYNADGSLAGENTDNGTHFKNNANKVYLPIEQTGNASRAYSLRILDGTTGIEAVVGEGAEVEGIYDLSGRRIKEMTAPGVYIVNGKKIIKK